MERIETALEFARWAIEFMSVRPFSIAFLLAILSLFFAALKERPFHRGRWMPHHWLSLSQLLFFPAMITVGVLYQNATGSRGVSSPAVNSSLNLLFYCSLAGCAFWIWRMRGFRWFACSLMALMELPTLGALFIAGMSVTGDWL